MSVLQYYSDPYVVSIKDYETLVIDIGMSTEDWSPAIKQAISDVAAHSGVIDSLLDLIRSKPVK